VVRRRRRGRPPGHHRTGHGRGESGARPGRETGGALTGCMGR
jgi:hypothetical protein